MRKLASIQNLLSLIAISTSLALFACNKSAGTDQLSPPTPDPEAKGVAFDKTLLTGFWLLTERDAKGVKVQSDTDGYMTNQHNDAKGNKVTSRTAFSLQFDANGKCHKFDYDPDLGTQTELETPFSVSGPIVYVQMGSGRTGEIDALAVQSIDSQTLVAHVVDKGQDLTFKKVTAAPQDLGVNLTYDFTVTSGTTAAQKTSRNFQPAASSEIKCFMKNNILELHNSDPTTQYSSPLFSIKIDTKTAAQPVSNQTGAQNIALDTKTDKTSLFAIALREQMPAGDFANFTRATDSDCSLTGTLVNKKLDASFTCGSLTPTTTSPANITATIAGHITCNIQPTPEHAKVKGPHVPGKR